MALSLSLDLELLSYSSHLNFRGTLFHIGPSVKNFVLGPHF